MVHIRPLLVDSDMHAFEPHLVILDARICAPQVDLPLTDRLHLRPGQGDTRLEGVLHEVLMICLTVDRHGIRTFSCHTCSPAIHPDLYLATPLASRFVVARIACHL